MYVPQRPAIHAGSPMDLFNMAKNFASQKEKKAFGDPVSLSNNPFLSLSLFNGVLICLFHYVGANWYAVELVRITFHRKMEQPFWW